MQLADLSPTERLVWEAFGSGTRVDVTPEADQVVRADVLRFLLLGGLPTEPGDLPALRLTGAHITGALEVRYADLCGPVSLRECRLDNPMNLYGARLRQLSLTGCSLPGFIATNATIEANVRLSGLRSTDEINLTGAHIGGALILNGAQLSGAPIALNASRLHVGNDVVAQRRFTSTGEIRLNNAEIGGSMRWEGASVEAMSALDIRVDAVANLCQGFTASGPVRFAYAHVTSRLCFEGASLTYAGGTALDLRHVTARELVLRPATPPGGTVDVSHARFGLLRDDPGTWPPALYLDGLTYDALSDVADQPDRLRWLRLDPRGFRPQAYEQLAIVYRGSGRDDDARAILLAGERHRRETLGRLGRLWGHIQDLTVGYGYRPRRAAAWLVALLVLGTAVFGRYPPRPADPATAPTFVAPAFTLDLIMPVIDFGQQSAFRPRGATIWLAYALMVAGLLFVTTIAAAAARRLRRE